MTDAILVVNAGSSSVKFALYRDQGEDLAVVYRGLAEGIGEGVGDTPEIAIKDTDGETVFSRTLDGGSDQQAALKVILDWLRGELRDHRLIAAGHRVVHGGPDYHRPMLVDDATLDKLRGFIPLAPLHQPHNLRALEAVRTLMPDLPQIACFDTAFHRDQPKVAQRFALPYEYEDKGVLRYGFHGLSYDYIASVLPDIDPRAAEGRCIVAHLGNGASMCAIQAGRSVASSMGFTALDGLPMGKRCGQLDPGVVLYLMQSEGMDADAIEDLLYRRSGLYGMSGYSSDMRALLEAEPGNPRVAAALETYVYRCVREIGSLAAAMGGLGALVFTAGVGENAAPVRARICEQLAWLGGVLDTEANAAGGPNIAASASRIGLWVVPTNEEWVIARAARGLVA